MLKTPYFLGTILAIFLSGAIGSFIYYDVKKSTVESTINPISTPTILFKDEPVVESIVSVEEVSKQTDITTPNKIVSIKTPNLDRSVIFTENIVPEQQEVIKKEISELSNLLKKDSNLFNDWLDLGLLRKSIGDYEGARDAWEYASVIRPNNYLSFSNLGMLYAYYLSNPIKAEANFLRSVQNDPKIVYLYQQIVDFYVDVLRDVGHAKKFLKESMKNEPNISELPILLKNL